MNVVAPAARDKKTLLKVNGQDAETLLFEEGNMKPQDVMVTYNGAVQKLAVTEVNLMLKILVDVE